MESADDSATLLATQGMAGNSDVGVLVVVPATCTYSGLGQLTKRKSSPQPDDGAPTSPWDGECNDVGGNLKRSSEVTCKNGMELGYIYIYIYIHIHI